MFAGIEKHNNAVGEIERKEALKRAALEKERKRAQTAFEEGMAKARAKLDTTSKEFAEREKKLKAKLDEAQNDTNNKMREMEEQHQEKLRELQKNAEESDAYGKWGRFLGGIVGGAAAAFTHVLTR